jgi:formate dehydrogenase major subunit
MKNAIERGAKLILMDPRRTELSRLATHMLQFRADTDCGTFERDALHDRRRRLVNQEFVATRTSGFEELSKRVLQYTPERMAPVCGIDAQTIREVAAVRDVERLHDLLGHGHLAAHSRHRQRTLPDRPRLTDGSDRKARHGLHPLRGQNNVQGASDMGLIPMVSRTIAQLRDPVHHAFYEGLWNAKIHPKRGLTVVEIMHAAIAGEIRGMYIMGENPAMSDPDLEHAREAIASLEWLVVQDLFLTRRRHWPM